MSGYCFAMSTRTTPSNSRTALLIKWGLVLPLVLMLIAMIGIGARYIPGKRRLDRLRGEYGSPSGSGVNLGLEFEEVVPDWIRNRIGGHWCEPLDRLTRIYLNGAHDAALIERRGCFEAENVIIESDQEQSEISDQALVALGESHQMNVLAIYGGDFTRQGLLSLAKSPYLAKLELNNVSLSSDWCAAITEFIRLKELTVLKRDPGQLSPDEIECLAARPQLKIVRLNVGSSKHDWDPFATLPPLTAGRDWRIRVLELNRHLLTPLQQVRDLTSLSMTSDTITKEALVPLADLPALRSLQISVDFPGFHDEQLSHLRSCGKLEFLEIHEWSDSTTRVLGLNSLAALPALQDLILEACLTAEDYQGLAQLTNLRSLRFNDLCNASDVTPLKSLVNLQELELEGNYSVESLNVIRSMPRLHWLQFAVWANLSEYEHLKELFNRADMPAGLTADCAAALKDLEKQARDPLFQDHEITISLGRRVLLPEEWTPDPNFD